MQGLREEVRTSSDGGVDPVEAGSGVRHGFSRPLSGRPEARQDEARLVVERYNGCQVVSPRSG